MVEALVGLAVAVAAIAVLLAVLGSSRARRVPRVYPAGGMQSPSYPSHWDLATNPEVLP